jgi:hypothetical protein
MARPIAATPVLKGKDAERFIRRLEEEKDIPLPRSTQKTDMNALRAIVADIERKQQKRN